jgi:hypothetical protein
MNTTPFVIKVCNPLQVLYPGIFCSLPPIQPTVLPPIAIYTQPLNQSNKVFVTDANKHMSTLMAEFINANINSQPVKSPNMVREVNRCPIRKIHYEGTSQVF